uniref:UDP-N-acetylglucosamine transferase subunit ALG13 n=1 Tax=Astatotilapia calliptera TaxID=8154 RepID=A0A3P8QC11_ASTCA
MKTVFVTVGTTSFDELIESITSSEATQALKARGYERLVLQVGRGSVLPAADSCPHIRLEAFRFKNSIAEDISQADLVISHAGAGSCLEALGAGKSLLVVVNDKLMDNHQLELARQLHMDSHLLYCTCSCLSLDEMFQHPDRNSKDHGPLSPAALPAWTAKEICRLYGQSSWH